MLQVGNIFQSDSLIIAYKEEFTCIECLFYAEAIFFYM